jgi:hypothetical protein
MKSIAHFVVNPQPDGHVGGNGELFHPVSEGRAERGFGCGVFFRIARAGRFEPPCALSQIFMVLPVAAKFLLTAHGVLDRAV